MFLHLYDVHIFAPTQAVAPVLNEDVSRRMSDLSGGMGQYLPGLCGLNVNPSYFAMLKPGYLGSMVLQNGCKAATPGMLTHKHVGETIKQVI
jgi:hypothetical protein